MEYTDLGERLSRVEAMISAACDRGGRPRREVTVIGVTKGHPPSAIEAALAVGLRDIGENRIQELASKVEGVGRSAARWHLIGHLQRNKVRKALELADLIHSLDSVRLARRMSEEVRERGGSVEALIEVNVSGEETKGGLVGERTLDEIGEICALPGLRVVGLMTMAPFTDDRAVQRKVFGATRELALRAAASVEGFEARHLSMGMSGDFEVAVEEGSTLVRLGTVLFGERDA